MEAISVGVSNSVKQSIRNIIESEQSLDEILSNNSIHISSVESDELFVPYPRIPINAKPTVKDELNVKHQFNNQVHHQTPY